MKTRLGIDGASRLTVGIVGGAILGASAMIAGGAGQPASAPTRVVAARWEYATYAITGTRQERVTQNDKTFVGARSIAASLGIEFRDDYIGAPRMLDTLGAAGWELVSVQNFAEGVSQASYTFKRPL